MPKKTENEKYLEERAKTVNQLYAAANKVAWKIGKALVEVREKLGKPFRQWEAWVENNCVFSKATARNYRRVYHVLRDKETDANRFFDTLLILITKKEFPAKARDFILVNSEFFCRRGVFEEVKRIWRAFKGSELLLLDEALSKLVAGEEVELPSDDKDPKALRKNIAKMLEKLEESSPEDYSELLEEFGLIKAGSMPGNFGQTESAVKDAHFANN